VDIKPQFIYLCRMETTRETLFILISTPFYAVVIGIEMLLSSLHHRKLYSTKGTLANIYLTSLNFGLDILMLGACLALLTFFGRFAFFSINNVYFYWAALLVAEDFMYYLLHYIDHYCRFFWAIHVTHHSSEEFNFTVGFRSSVFQPLYRMFYFIPLALCGFKPLDIMFMYSATQIYGILIHTQYTGKLGFLEWFMSTPSHHRVHHASNPQYLDKNLGMVFIIWDKLFGTFRAESGTEAVKYGLTKNIDNLNPVTLVFHEWIEMWKDVRKPLPLRIKLMYLFGPPGWSHDGSRKTSRQLEKEYFQNKK
jgi:sterol desaturase/sphingolipid hydroxylase (fatty acid hydroxylase superfamily)